LSDVITLVTIIVTTLVTIIVTTLVSIRVTVLLIGSTLQAKGLGFAV
jgi:hypothetical protein